MANDLTGPAVALTGFAVWNLFDSYTGLAPSMSELRETHSDDTSARQRLVDADMCVGGVAVLAGSAAAYLSRSWVPLVLVTLALGWVSWYHHAALAGPTPRQIEGL